jgi:hypothetical protein
MIEGFIDNMAKVTTFGAVAIVIFALIIIGFYGLVKEVFCFLDLVSYPWQISQPKRSAVFVDEVFEGKIVKSQVVISEIKTILWKKVRLVD